MHELAVILSVRVISILYIIHCITSSYQCHFVQFIWCYSVQFGTVPSRSRLSRVHNFANRALLSARLPLEGQMLAMLTRL